MAGGRDKGSAPRRWAVLARSLLALGVACLGLFFLFSRGDRLIMGVDAKARYFKRNLGARLNARHGMLLYAPLDGPNPVNLVSGKFLPHHRCPSVKGVLGEARRMDDTKKAYLQTDVSFGFLPAGQATLAFWFKPLSIDEEREANILGSSKDGAVFSLRLVRGDLTAVCSSTNGCRTVSAPFPREEGFHHVAVSIASGSFALYIDGRERGAAALPGGFVAPHHLVGFGGDPRIPLIAELDDVALWTRPLGKEEVEGLYRSRLPLAFRYEPVVYTIVRVLEFGRSSLQVFFRVIDRLLPHPRGFALLRSDIPAIEMRWSKRDARHFRNAYEKTLLQGERTRKASRYRTITLAYGGSSRQVEACLDDLGMYEEAPCRYSFLVKAPPGFLPGGGSGFCRLYPLERYGVFHPDSLKPLPLSQEGIVRLFVQGDFYGFYLLESLDLQGSAWVVAGERNPRRTDFVLYDAQPSMAPGEKLLSVREVERRFQAMSSLLRSDMRFPWSPQEIKWRERTHAEQRALLSFSPPTVTASDLKGENPSASYVVTNLDLSVFGEGVTWSSSRPSVLEPDGTVHRPGGDVPAVVHLTGRFPGGSRRTYRFRVMPRSPRFPALHLHFSLPLDKGRDRDFTCRRFPAGEGEARWLSGTAGMGGGVHHRGNTSYVRAAKRSMSLEFDEAVDAGVTEEPCTHLLLLSGYADASRLRNRLSFDSFQAMRGDGPRRAPRVQWNEVFVNGEYAGLWEIASRLQDVTGGAFSQLFKVRVLNKLWATSYPDYLTFVGKVPFAADTFDGVVDLTRFVIESDRETFLAELDEHLDVEALADFLLLLNLTGNVDGRVTNQFLGRRAKDGKWECLPWDYDKTFMDKGSKTAWLSNPLFSRLLTESPDFLELVKKRWQAHRAGPLSDDKVLGWIDRQFESLDPYMEEEFRLLQPMDTEGDFRKQVLSLRSEAAFRLHQLDERMR